MQIAYNKQDMTQSELKLELAKQITHEDAHIFQDIIIETTNSEFSLLNLDKSSTSLDALLSCMLVETYWHPNTKNLYVTSNTLSLQSCQESLYWIASALEQCRPERKYIKNNRSIEIEFGSSKSSLALAIYGYNFIGDGFQNIIVDVNQHEHKIKNISKYIDSLASQNQKLIIVNRNDKSISNIACQKTNNKLDNLIS